MLLKKISLLFVVLLILTYEYGLYENAITEGLIFEKDSIIIGTHELAWIVKDYSVDGRFYMLSYDNDNRTLSKSLLLLPGFEKIDGNNVFLLPYIGSSNRKAILAYSKTSSFVNLFMISNNTIQLFYQIKELGIDYSTIPRVQEDKLIYTTEGGTCSEISLIGEIDSNINNYPLYNLNSRGDAIIVIENEDKTNTTGLPDFDEFVERAPEDRICIIDANNTIYEIMCIGQECEYCELVSWNWYNDSALLLLLRQSIDPTRIDLYRFDNIKKQCTPLTDQYGRTICIVGKERIEIYDNIYCDSEGYNMAYIQFDDDYGEWHSIILQSLITGESTVIYSEIDDNTKIQFPASLVWYD